MTHVDLPASLLKRKAVVYVRQSTPAQVQLNRESQRRQMGLTSASQLAKTVTSTQPGHQPCRTPVAQLFRLPSGQDRHR